MTWLWIAIGGALGSVARYGASLGIARMFGETFPWGTLLVNVTGSFAIGLFSSVTGTEGRLLVSPEWRQFFMVGICGGYTTFSSFSLQTLNLMRDGQWLYAGANVVFSVVLCLAGVWAGHMMAMQLNQGR
jgi:CrcB protein